MKSATSKCIDCGAIVHNGRMGAPRKRCDECRDIARKLYLGERKGAWDDANRERRNAQNLARYHARRRETEAA